MKFINYDGRTLIEMQLRENRPYRPVPAVKGKYTHAQYKILYNLVLRKKIHKGFFEYILVELYGIKDWKQLDYQQMYELIHILTFFNYCH